MRNSNAGAGEQVADFVGELTFENHLTNTFFEGKHHSRKQVPVNWCPALGTVLANEEVIDGTSFRPI